MWLADTQGPFPGPSQAGSRHLAFILDGGERAGQKGHREINQDLSKSVMSQISEGSCVHDRLEVGAGKGGKWLPACPAALPPACPSMQWVKG